jgi:hypothetical protein
MMRTRGEGACARLKEAFFEPPMLIADAVVQALLAALLWIFSTRAVADGALLKLVWVEVVLLGYHCQSMVWRYAQAAGQVCYFCFKVDCGVCCMFCDGGSWAETCAGLKEAQFEPPLLITDTLCMRWYWHHSCGHFRCENWPMEHCCSQCGPLWSCCDSAAESRISDICRRLCRFVIVISGLIVLLALR